MVSGLVPSPMEKTELILKKHGVKRKKPGLTPDIGYKKEIERIGKVIEKKEIKGPTKGPPTPEKLFVHVESPQETARITPRITQERRDPITTTLKPFRTSEEHKRRAREMISRMPPETTAEKFLTPAKPREYYEIKHGAAAPLVQFSREFGPTLISSVDPRGWLSVSEKKIDVGTMSFGYELQKGAEKISAEPFKTAGFGAGYVTGMALLGKGAGAIIGKVSPRTKTFTPTKYGKYEEIGGMYWEGKHDVIHVKETGGIARTTQYFPKKQFKDMITTGGIEGTWKVTKGKAPKMDTVEIPVITGTRKETFMGDRLTGQRIRSFEVLDPLKRKPGETGKVILWKGKPSGKILDLYTTVDETTPMVTGAKAVTKTKTKASFTSGGMPARGQLDIAMEPQVFRTAPISMKADLGKDLDISRASGLSMIGVSTATKTRDLSLEALGVKTISRQKTPSRSSFDSMLGKEKVTTGQITLNLPRQATRQAPLITFKQPSATRTRPPALKQVPRTRVAPISRYPVTPFIPLIPPIFPEVKTKKKRWKRPRKFKYGERKFPVITAKQWLGFALTGKKPKKLEVKL